jgi:hypothetical protein
VGTEPTLEHSGFPVNRSAALAQQQRNRREARSDRRAAFDAIVHSLPGSSRSVLMRTVIMYYRISRKVQRGERSTLMSATTSLTASHVVSRVAASLLGGWLFAWGFTTLGIALALEAGMDFGQATTLVFLFSFIVFLTVFCWAYIASSVARVWGVLGGGGALMTTIAWWLTR